MSEDLIDNSSVNPTTESVKDYLENIISLMPGHIFWKDLNCRFLGCNDLQAKMAGLSSRHEIVGKSALDIISKNQPEADRVAQAEAIDNVDRKIMRTGVSLVVEEPLILDDGTEKIFLSQMSFITLKGPFHNHSKGTTRSSPNGTTRSSR